MLINVPFYDNIFHGLMFRGNYPIYQQTPANSSALMNRWALYSSLEGVLERFGLQGRPCLLRSVCEAAANRLDHDGLLGALLHLVLRCS
jgi:DM4/DM12 family